MATVNEKMTALADEIRELSGTSTSKSLDIMASDISTANAEVSSQADLIAQISTALEGKAGGSGGVTLPSLDNPASASDILSGKEAIDEEGNIITGTITTKTSSNLTANGATVTVPSGYYATNATKSVASGSAKTPATTITKTPSISVSSSGLITASVSGTQNVTPTVSAGYVSSGIAGTITVSGSNTKQLTTQAAKTVTPTTSNQTAVASGRYTTGTITVAGDSNLKAANIAEGVSIFGVTGTHAGSEDLDTVITELETKVATLNTTLDGKASGGGNSANIETCTVEFSIPNGLFSYAATIFVNGTITQESLVTGYSDTELIINNVIRGSVIAIHTRYTGDAAGGIVATNASLMFSKSMDLEGICFAFFSAD